MKLLTIVTRELDAFLEELISFMNKILHYINKVNKCTVKLVTIHLQENNKMKEKNNGHSSLFSSSNFCWSSQISKSEIHPIKKQ